MATRKTIAALLVSCGATLALAQAGTGFTLTDGGAVFRQSDSPTSGTGGGVSSTDFRLSGGATGTDQLFQNWWWYRVACESRQTAFYNATGTQIPAANRAVTSWVFPQFTADLEYHLQATSPTNASMVEVLTVRNTTAAPLTLNLFNYTDFDLNGSFFGDSATLISPDLMRVTGDYPSPTVSADFQGYGANVGYKVGPFTASRLGLADPSVTNANNTGLPLTNDDFSGFWEWQLVLTPGASGTLVERLGDVPEPTTLLLFLVLLRPPRR